MLLLLLLLLLLLRVVVARAEVGVLGLLLGLSPREQRAQAGAAAGRRVPGPREDVHPGDVDEEGDDLEGGFEGVWGGGGGWRRVLGGCLGSVAGGCFGRCEGWGVCWAACQKMEPGVWFSQSLYMIIEAVTVQTVKKT